MKTFDKKDVFTCANEENASSYIMKQGYFADDIKELKEAVVSKPLSYLIGIELDATYPFASNLGEKGTYRLFIPADKIKEVEEPKKYRPFKSIDEFKKETRLDLLSIVRYRYIIEKPRNLTTTGFGVITDFCTCGDKTYYITIGDTSFNLNELFDYEYLDEHGNWKPFGVEE